MTTRSLSRSRPLGKGRLLVLGTALIAAACSAGESTTAPPGTTGPPPTTRPTLDPTYRPSGHAASGDVFVHLFAWPWPDIAAECESFLGPHGYDAVQVSPPQEHVVLPAAGHPWWQRYQPVSYRLESRSGSPAEFADMVERCEAAGVDIYADAVINHMTAGSGVGSAGTSYTKYDYPGLWDAADFHPPCTVTNYQNAANVQDCELLGLADLHTGRASVRETLAGYLLDLVRLGVAGFRIDAAKHIQPVELDSVLDLVNTTAADEGRPRPYYFAEVIDHGGEAVAAADYYGLAYSSGGVADITEFRFRPAGARFGPGGDPIAGLEDVSTTGAGLMPADKAVVFIQNHDTQRHDGVSYRDGDLYRLANVWMLAQPYGYPKVMSGYAFDRSSQVGRDAGPPSDDGVTRPVECVDRIEDALIGDWVCEHRDPMIAVMVGFRDVVAGTELTGWWDDDADAIAFSRGDRGFVAINAGPDAIEITTTTGLPAGSYCDILSGGPGAGACTGPELEVGQDGAITVQLEPTDAIAIHLESRL